MQCLCSYQIQQKERTRDGNKLVELIVIFITRSQCKIHEYLHYVHSFFRILNTNTRVYNFASREQVSK